MGRQQLKFQWAQLRATDCKNIHKTKKPNNYKQPYNPLNKYSTNQADNLPSNIQLTKQITYHLSYKPQIKSFNVSY